MKIHGVDVAEIERRILASDWLAARVASAAADREAVERVRALADECDTLRAYISHDFEDHTAREGWRSVNRHAATVIRAALSVPTEAEGAS